MDEIEKIESNWNTTFVEKGDDRVPTGDRHWPRPPHGIPLFGTAS